MLEGELALVRVDTDDAVDADDCVGYDEYVDELVATDEALGLVILEDEDVAELERVP